MRSILAILLLISISPANVIAQSTNEDPMSIAAKESVIHSLASSLERNYVHQDKAKEIISKLRKQLSNGQLETVIKPEKLAELLSTHLVKISQDHHFSVGFDPDWIAESKTQSNEDDTITLREDELESLQSSNFGFKKLEILEGNIGYIRFDYFPDPELSFAAGAAAMRFIENTDAIIFDLRYHRGGHNQFGQFLSSYLFPAGEPQLLHEYSYRNGGKTINGTYHSLPILPGPRKTKTPVYILTSSTTFSAGEWFAYALQKLGRAKVVGRQTTGASHSVVRKAIDDRFVLQVPVGVGRDPIEKSDFEGVGVAPDHNVTSFSALAVAHKLAFEEIVLHSPESQGQLAWLLPILNSRINPTVADISYLSKFTGQYEGRSIELHNGSLLYHWRDRFNLSLIPLQANLFSIEGVEDFRFRFVEVDGEVTALERVEKEGHVIVYPAR